MLMVTYLCWSWNEWVAISNSLVVCKALNAKIFLPQVMPSLIVLFSYQCLSCHAQMNSHTYECQSSHKANHICPLAEIKFQLLCSKKSRISGLVVCWHLSKMSDTFLSCLKWFLADQPRWYQFWILACDERSCLRWHPESKGPFPEGSRPFSFAEVLDRRSSVTILDGWRRWVVSFFLRWTVGCRCKTPDSWWLLFCGEMADEMYFNTQLPSMFPHENF